MKAAYITKHGNIDVFKYGDMPDPVAGPGEVVVAIRAASVNGADWKVRAGKSGELPGFPYVLGRDFSGVVSAVGEGVKDFELGDPVFAVCDQGQEGAYAEKIAIKASICCPKPDILSHSECAALALVGLTAVKSIEQSLKLKKGEKILIQGGAGGVAGFAIELAKHIGAYVITTTSEKNIDYVRGLGADEVIDYNAQDFTKAVSDCDCVFETVGGAVAEKSFQVLKPGGRIAFIASGAKGLPSPDPKWTSLRPAVTRDRKSLQRVVELVEADAVSIPEITLYPLSKAADANLVSEKRHLRGKLVLETG